MHYSNPTMLLYRYLCLEDHRWPSISLVQKLLAAGAKADIPVDSETGQTCLHALLTNGDIEYERTAELLDIFMAHRNSVIVPDKTGRSALFHGGYFLPHFRFQREMLSQKDNNGKTALIDAVECRCVNSVIQLLEAGASVHDIDNDNRSPLHFISSSYGRFTMASLLLLKGADSNAKDKNGCTPLSLWAENNKSLFGQCYGTGVIDLMMKLGADSSIKDNSGETIFDKLEQNEEVACDILHGRPPWQWGAKWHQRCLAQTIRDTCGESMPQISKDFVPWEMSILNNPRCYSLAAGIEHLISLVNSNRGFDVRDKEGNTPLHFMMRGDHYYPGCGYYFGHYLLLMGADVDPVNKRGETPLMLAARRFCDCDEISILLTFGADIERRDRKGKTAVDHARECADRSCGRHENIQLLERASEFRRLGLSAQNRIKIATS